LEHMEQLRPTANICGVEPMSWLKKAMLPDQQSSVPAACRIRDREASARPVSNRDRGAIQLIT